MESVSLYIHFPWCIKKCPYCDFNSHVSKKPIPNDQYLLAIKQDIESHLLVLQKRKVKTIFLGGGTPSIFPIEKMHNLFDYLWSLDIITDDAEITIEVNPGVVERGSFFDYKRMGINRISLGVQSFNAKHLKRLGRIHKADEVYQAAEQINAAGFNNYNLDLMHGLIGQNTDEALDDLQCALSLNPAHLSWYQLTIEPNTVYYDAFHNDKIALPSEDSLESIELHGKAILVNKGFFQYETSAYAIDAKYRARHNLNYWQYGDYIGVGAGAHSKISEFPVITRCAKQSSPAIYMQTKKYIQKENFVDNSNRIYEFAFNVLRLHMPIELTLFTKTTNLPVSVWLAKSVPAIEKKLLNIHDGKMSTTELGRRYLNNLLEFYHPEFDS